MPDNRCRIVGIRFATGRGASMGYELQDLSGNPILPLCGLWATHEHAANEARRRCLDIVRDEEGVA